MKIISNEFIEDLMNLRRKAELDPKGYKNLKDKYTHDIPYTPENKIQERIEDIFKSGIHKYGKRSWQFMSFLKVGVGIEYNSKEVAEIYKTRNETPPAYDLSIRGSCFDESIFEVMNAIIMKNNIPSDMINTIKFIKRCKLLREQWERKEIKKNRVGKLRNGTATRIKGVYNFVDITGIVFHNDNYNPPSNILRRLGVDRKEYWDTLDWTEHFKDCHGQHFVVPGKECKEIREVYAMDPEEQLDGRCIAMYLRYIAIGFDTNATTDQMKWIRKCIKEKWNIIRWIISTDMEKYSDSLNRKKLLRILLICGIIEENEFEELDRFWGSDVWDRDKKYPLRNSDSVKQGQYGIFDAMTIVNMFLQCIIYDLLHEDCEYREVLENERYRIRNNNSALGDDTVLAFLNEHSNGLDVVKNVFGFMGVNISNSKTHIMSRGFNYRNGKQLDELGFIDFAKRIVTGEGLLSYISANAISKNNFDDYVMEYFRILEEDEELAESFGKLFLQDKYDFIKNLHRINGGRREDAITDDDMILFEYRMNKMISVNSVSPSELLKQLKWIKSQGILLSNTKLLGWLPEYDSNNDLYLPNEEDDQRIIAEILNYRDYGRELCFEPRFYIGKTWNEVKNDDIISEIISTIRINEKEIARRKENPSHVYKDMSNLNLTNLNHSLFIFEYSTRNENGFREYSDMKNEVFIRKLHSTFSECVQRFRTSHKINTDFGIFFDVCWYCDRSYLKIGNYEYRLYNLMRIRNDSRPPVPFDVFDVICRDAFPNKDMTFIYNSFINSLPYLSRNDDYYNYFY